MSVLPLLISAALAAPASGPAAAASSQAPGQAAHELVVAGRVTALTGAGLTLLSIPAFALTGRCGFRQSPDPSLDLCDSGPIFAASGLAVTAVGTGMVVGGSLGTLHAARGEGVVRSPAGGLVFLGTGAGLLTVAGLSPQLGLDAAPWTGLGLLSTVAGVVLLDHAHVQARRELTGPRVQPVIDPVGRTVGIQGRF